MLTKRDFERIADDLRVVRDALRAVLDYSSAADIANQAYLNLVIRILIRYNPNFDRDKFLARVNRE